MRTSAIAVAACCAVTISLLIPSKRKNETGNELARSTPGPAIKVTDGVAKETIPIAEPITIARTPQLKEIASLRNYLRQQQEPIIQKIQLTGSTDTVISFAHGTKISVDPNAFINERTGLPVKDPVEIEVKEFYDIEDMMMAHLTTATKDAILETNGMIYLQASAGGEACKLRNGETIQVSFPIKNRQPGMELFSGEKDASGAIMWRIIRDKGKKESASIPTEDIQKTVPLTDDTSLQNQVIDTTINTRPEFLGGINAVAKNINSLKNHFPFDQKAGAVVVDIVTNRQGRVCWVKKIGAFSQDYYACLSTAIYKMPSWKPAIVKGKPSFYTTRMMVLFTPASPKMMKFLPYWKSPDQVKEKDLAAFLYPKTRTGLSNDYYSFTTSQLGWLNCDRFYNTPGPKTELYVSADMAEPMDIKLIFHNYKSILAGCDYGYKYSFGQVPKGEPVTVIAIKGSANRLQMAVLNTKVINKEITGLRFFPVTIADVKATIKQFNSLATSTAMKE